MATKIELFCYRSKGETAKGEYPVEAVSIMSKIAQDAEGAVYNQQVSLLTHLYRHLVSKYTIIIF